MTVPAPAKDSRGITHTIRWAAFATLTELAGRTANYALDVHTAAERFEAAAAGARTRAKGPGPGPGAAASR